MAVPSASRLRASLSATCARVGVPAALLLWSTWMLEGVLASTAFYVLNALLIGWCGCSLLQLSLGVAFAKPLLAEAPQSPLPGQRQHVESPRHSQEAPAACQGQADAASPASRPDEPSLWTRDARSGEPTSPAAALRRHRTSSATSSLFDGAVLAQKTAASARRHSWDSVTTPEAEVAEVPREQPMPPRPAGSSLPRQPSMPVFLHVYDVTLDVAIQQLNGVLAHPFWPLTFGGVFHVGVEVVGREWSYGYCSTGSGVSSTEPRRHPMHHFRETCELPCAALSEEAVNRVLLRLTEEYSGQGYHLVRRNCCTFASLRDEKITELQADAFNVTNLVSSNTVGVFSIGF